MNDLHEFYRETLRKLLEARILSRDSSILVTCGYYQDRDVLKNLGFTNVTISNLFDAEPTIYQPFRWSNQDAEKLSFADGSFDFCVVHAGLHHCRSPHQAVLEMYRVCSKGVIAFEPVDNLVVRLSARFGFAEEYEPAAVAGHNYLGGGWRNTIIPNYVHRWTRAEIERMVKSYAPYARHRVLFFQDWSAGQVCGKLKSRLKFAAFAGRVLETLVRTGLKLAPKKLANQFAFVILRPQLPRDLHPWLEWQGSRIGLNYEWFKSHKFPDPERAKTAHYDWH